MKTSRPWRRTPALPRRTPGSRWAAAAGVLLLTATGLAGATAPAHAGSNGQHLVVHDPRHITASIRINGTIHNGQYTHTCVNIPGDPAWIDQNWWKGTIKVDTYAGWNCSGTYYTTFSFAVPTTQSSDWHHIYLNYP
ncbi:hypothetical protein OHB11_00695 [Streptomyces zaomyceticus]|uniref:hypothetical protein n=1 Tax=Streptomyces zaomyceticus TaxID=68286 RepID=UPI003252B9E4